jgi:putative hydrolase of HD superfamily
MNEIDERLERQLAFIIEIDRLKGVLRRTLITDRSRFENSAEHSWHLALMAILLADRASSPVDVARVVEMVLVHDIVEVDAGDTFAYDDAAHADKAERERAAADRLFGLLPPEQEDRLRALWDEFEDAETPEACFANALDRLQPLLLNVHSRGGAWRTHGITSTQVLERMRPVETGMPRVWSYVVQAIDGACEAGDLKA